MKPLPAFRILCLHAAALGVMLTGPHRAHADKGPGPEDFLLRVANPSPETLPTLSVWEEKSLSRGKKLTMVAATFPNVPHLTCDSWCYESPVNFISCREVGGGGLELRHRFQAHPGALLVTDVTAEVGAVQFVAHVESDSTMPGSLPEPLPVPNLCWQLRRAPAFASAPEPYTEFIKRCFVFTAAGRTFLHKTVRRRIPVQPADHRYNNPPWVQMYASAGREVPPAAANSWADFSPDQFTVPVIGTVSRDGKYLAALANGSANIMCQAWHDCLHNNPPWLPADAAPEKRIWRLKVFAMENDPEALLTRVQNDFAPQDPETR